MPAKRSPAKSGRKRLTPAAQKRGLDAAQVVLAMDAPEVAPLVAQVMTAGGAPIGAYREPLSGKPLLLAVLPLAAVEPTPFQRDLSPTHAKRLAQKIEESGSFLDPLIVVRGADGRLWTPNGRHRLAAGKVLGLKQITALVSPDEQLAFRILALNTEKAHNLKDRSLEVIRMARALAARSKTARESDHADDSRRRRCSPSGCATSTRPVRRRRLSSVPAQGRPLQRQAAGDEPARTRRLRREGAGDRRRGEAGRRRAQQRGFRSPYLRTLVVARINPVRFHRAKRGDTTPPMTLPAALTRMLAGAKKFDVQSVKFGDLAMVAAVAAE